MGKKDITLQDFLGDPYIFRIFSMAAVSAESRSFMRRSSARLTASSVQKITGEHREKGQGI